MSSKIDFTFGVEMEEPLNEYFTYYINDMIDDIVKKSFNDNTIYDKKKFIQELKNDSQIYIEKTLRNEGNETMDILFSTYSIVETSYELYKNLYKLKKFMINFNQNRN